MQSKLKREEYREESHTHPLNREVKLKCQSRKYNDNSDLKNNLIKKIMQPLGLGNRQKKGSTMKVLNLKKQTFLKKYQENPKVKNKKCKMDTSKHSESITIAKMEAYQLNKEKVLKTFWGQVWHGLYFICTICRHSFYEQSVRLLDKQKYEQDFSAELYDPITSFNQKVYICDTCHKILRKRSIPC